MCYNCGCAIPDDNMGHPENITEKTLEELAGKWGKDLDTTKKELLQILQNNDPRLEQEPLKSMFEAASKAWGQDIEEGKKNTFSLLKSQVG